MLLLLEEGVLGDMRSDTLRSTAAKIASAVIAEDDADEKEEVEEEGEGEVGELEEEEEKEEEDDDANALTWRSCSTNSFSAPVTGPCDCR